MLNNCELINGDCFTEIPKLQDNIIDLVLTDFPYGISFMGKAFDTFSSNKAFQEFIEKFGTTVLPKMKDGAFLVTTFTPRQDTLWRCLAGLEKAGFNLGFSSCFWLYHCLSADTEVLTESGWERYDKTKRFKTSKILIYDIDSNDFKFEKPSKWHDYNIKDFCIRIKSDFTDQLVSKGHRVIIEREGKLLWEFAERLSIKEKIPMVDNLQNLWKNNLQKISTKKNLFLDLSKKIDFGKKQGRMGYFKEKRKNQKMFLLWKRILCFSKPLKNNKLLFSQMQWKNENESINSIPKKTQSLEKELDNRTQKETGRENVWGKELGLERGGNLFQNARELYWSKICSLPERIFTNGSRRWLCYGTPFVSGGGIETVSFEERSCASFRPQPSQQQTGKFGFVCEQSRPQIARTQKSYQTTLATVSREYYEGMIFCPSVSTGCFVARRNGKIFLTGNSGFPKASDISKSADKRQGIKRQGAGTQGNTFPLPNEYEDGEPVSEQAKIWFGWKSCSLKPAVEMIIVAQKPRTEKTIVEQVLKNGCGAINIEECRIPYANPEDSSSSSSAFQQFSSNKKASDNSLFEIPCIERDISTNGRFPANLMVSGNPLKGKETETKPHGGDYQKLDVEGNWGFKRLPFENSDFGSPNRFYDLDRWAEKRNITLAETFDGEQSAFFDVPKPASSEKEENLEEQNETNHCGVYGDGIGNVPKVDGIRPNPKKNFHPTTKPVLLFSYLAKLFCQPNGLILDPFMGSGTTGIATLKQGFRFIGIEKEKDYFKIAETRIKPQKEQKRLFEGEQ